MRFSAGSRSSSRNLRSWSQKNLASARRARSTRSLPAVIVSRLVGGHHVGDDEETRRQLAFAVLQGEIFLVRAHGGDAGSRAADPYRPGSIRPISTTGHSTSPATSSSSASSGRICRPSVRRQALGMLADDVHALGRVDHHLAHAEPRLVGVEIGHREGLGSQEAMAVGLLARGDPARALGRAEIDLERHELPVEDGDDVVQRADPAHPVIGPAHGARPGKPVTIARAGSRPAPPRSACPPPARHRTRTCCGRPRAARRGRGSRARGP